MYYKNREIYKGKMKDKKKEGIGEIIYKNGDKYKGEWKNDKREGKGKIIIRKGGEYEGIWKEDEIIITKKMRIYKDDNEYIGEIKEGKWN